jgi:hypothetical protein
MCIVAEAVSGGAEKMSVGTLAHKLAAAVYPPSPPMRSREQTGRPRQAGFATLQYISITMKSRGADGAIR